MKYLFSLILIVLMGCSGNHGTHAEVQLATIQCDNCKQTIETGLVKVKGIIKVNVDVEKKVGYITYQAGIIDLTGVEKAIAALGYQANDTPADPEAYTQLPSCCQIPVNP